MQVAPKGHDGYVVKVAKIVDGVQYIEKPFLVSIEDWNESSEKNKADFIDYCFKNLELNKK